MVKGEWKKNEFWYLTWTKSASESLTCTKVMIAPQSPSIPRNSDGWKSRTMWAAATCKFSKSDTCDDFESQDLLKRDKMRIPGRLQQGQQIANPTCPQAISLPLLWAELLAAFVAALCFLFFSIKLCACVTAYMYDLNYQLSPRLCHPCQGILWLIDLVFIWIPELIEID